VTDKRPTKQQRRDEAKQRRLVEMKRRERQARVRKITTYIVVGVVVVGAAIGIAAAQKAGKKTNIALTTQLKAAGCEDVLTPKDQGAGHVPRPQVVQYDSKPPTSGQHWSDAGAPAPTGVHTTQIEDEAQVHNLEHSNVIVHYNGVSSDLQNKLDDLASIDPTRIIVEPYTTMKYKVAFTAWGHLVGCSNPNDNIIAAAKAFISTYKGKAGPEGDLPGTPLPGSS
jgi:Protein of unknown function (DUF3105)